MVHDVPTDQATDSRYECLRCGAIVTNGTHPVECEECGASLQNRAMSLE